MASAVPARAEVGTTVSLFSELHFRGYSLSEGRPVAIVDVDYDHSSGLYGAIAGTAVLDRGAPSPLGLQVTGGYARRLKSGTTLDVGVTHSTYSHYPNDARGNSYSEIYAGISRGMLSSRIFLSPHYFEQGRWTAYGEVNASLSPARRWNVEGHLGVQLPIQAQATERYEPQLDWRLGLTRGFGPLALHAAWSAGAPGRDYYRGHHHPRSAFILGASWVL